jgi:hypothetical protein
VSLAALAVLIFVESAVDRLRRGRRSEGAE